MRTRFGEFWLLLWLTPPAAPASSGQVSAEVRTAVEEQVEALFALLATAAQRELSEGELVALIGTGSACSVLLPEAAAVGTGDFALWRAAAPPPGPVHRGRQALAAELGRLAASWRPEQPPPSVDLLALDVELLTLDPASDGWVAELAYAARAGPREQAARWATRWRAAPRQDMAPQLVYVELVEFSASERRAPGAGLRDASPQVFGQQPAWRDDLAHSFERATAGLQRELEPGWEGHHGLAVADVDGDGREDLFVCQPGGLPNRLFLQRADGSAEESAARLRLDLLDATAAALWLDLDGDGDQDLVTSLSGAVLVHENREFQGSPRFGLRAALAASGASSLAAADFDLDGDLDLFAAGTDPACDPERFPEPVGAPRNGRPSHLFRTSLEGGEWNFSDVTLECGLGELRGFKSAASFEDHDRDGDPDLFVADAFGPLRLFENVEGHFRDATSAAGLEGLLHVHSLAWADLDRDGSEELCTAAAPLPGPGAHPAGGLVWLERQEAGGFARAGRLEVGWPFGAAAVDLQNDGWTDLLVLGGSSARLPWNALAALEGSAFQSAAAALLESPRARVVADRGQAARAWLSTGAPPSTFVPAAGPLGLGEAWDGRALASLDWNRDGALDLVQSARGAPRLRLWLNRGAGGERALGLLLVDRGPNRDAIGARVELETSTGPLVLALRAGGGFLSQGSKWLHGALPSSAPVQASVTWPDGTREPFADLAPGRWILNRGSGRAQPAGTPATGPGSEPGAERIEAERIEPLLTPAADRAGLLAAPVALPSLLLTDAAGAQVSLSDQHPRPRLVLLPQAPEAGLLSGRGEFERLGLELLALREGADPLEPGAWPAQFRMARPEEHSVLSLLADLCFEIPARDRPTSAVLIDSAGRLRAVYRGALDPALVSAHGQLLDASPEDLRDAAVPFPGRWHAPPARADLHWLAARLRAPGFPEAAGELEVLAYETRELTRESMLTETGLVRIRQGGLEEAVRHLTAAVELAPEWPPPLIHLGRALLALERPAEAAPLLERALRARPRDELAQALLSRAYSELGLDGVARALAPPAPLEPDREQP